MFSVSTSMALTISLTAFHAHRYQTTWVMVIPAVFDSYAEIVLQDKDPALSYQGLNQRLGEGGYSAVYECAHANDG